MASGLSLSSRQGAAGCVRLSGFHEKVIGKPESEGPAGFLCKKIITVNGAGFGTVPRIVVSGALIKRYAGDAAAGGKTLYSLLYSDALLRTMRGEISGALKQFGEVPLIVKLLSAAEDMSVPLFSTGVAPISTSIKSVEEALCRSVLSAGTGADLSVVIQPAIGGYFDAGAYGKLYGPLVSGTATAGSSIETTVCAGYDTHALMPLTVYEGDGRPLKEILSQKRQSHFIQVLERGTNLTSLSYAPAGQLCDETLGWLFSRLRRLHQFAGTEVVAEWAVAGGEGRPAPALLRMAEKAREKDPEALLSGKTVHGHGKRECAGIVYEYAMRPDSIRSIDAVMSGYILVCRATNVINSGVTPQDIRNASAIVMLLDVPEKAHKAAKFCEEAGAAGKIVIHAESKALDAFEGKLGTADLSRGGYMITACRTLVDAGEGCVRVRA